MKLIFFGTSHLSTILLEELTKHHQIELCVTTPDAPSGRKKILTPSQVSITAQKLGLEIYKPEKLKTIETLDFLKSKSADCFVVASYGKILPQDLLNIPTHGSINFHPSLLPKYRGASPIQYALKNGETETGVTIIQMDSGMDTGDILEQKHFQIDPEDNYETLETKLTIFGKNLLLDVLIQIETGNLKPKKQNNEEATYTKIIEKEDGKINFAATATEIKNLQRAYWHWPGIWTTQDGEIIKLLEIEKANDDNTTVTGTVLEGGKVQTGEGQIQIQQLQQAGKNPTKIKDYLNGHKDFVGSVLGT